MMDPQNRRAFALLAAAITFQRSSYYSPASITAQAKIYEEFIAQAGVDAQETPVQQVNR